MDFNPHSSLAGRDALLRSSLHSSLRNIMDSSQQAERSVLGATSLASRPSPLPSALGGSSSPFGGMAGQPSPELSFLGHSDSLLSQRFGSALSPLLGGFGSGGLRGVGEAGRESLAHILLARAREEQIMNRAKAVVLQDTFASQQRKQAEQDAYIKLYLQSQLFAAKAASPGKSLLMGSPALPPHFFGALSLARGGPSTSDALLGNPVLSSRFSASATLPRGEPHRNGENAAAAQLRASRAAASARAGEHLSAAEKKHKVTQTLRALGVSLRSRYDPFIDCIDIEDPYDPDEDTGARSRGGVLEHFPERLHRMLLDIEREGKGDVACFLPHGRAFAVLDERRFVEEVMPGYFKQSKWHSFARQLNLYGFVRMASGPDAGAYYHELFLKSRSSLCKYMRRVGVPRDQQDRRKCRPKNVVDIQEPDFYSMRPSTLPEDHGRRAAISRATTRSQENDCG